MYSFRLASIIAFLASIYASIPTVCFPQDLDVWVDPKSISSASHFEGGWEEDGVVRSACLAQMQNSEYIAGKLIGTQCNVAQNGIEVATSAKAILSNKNVRLSWEAINNSKPEGWVRVNVGQFEGRDVFACRAKHRDFGLFDKGVHVGTLSGLECRYGYDGQQVVVRDDPWGDIATLATSPFWVLYREKLDLSGEQKRQIEEAIFEIEGHWLDKHGFLNISKRDSLEIDNENPVLFTAEYLFLLRELGMLEGARRTRYLTWARSAIDKLRLKPGLFDRRPEDKLEDRGNHCVRHFSRDEQIGLLLIDHVFDNELGISKEISEFGRNNNWIFENRSWRADGSIGNKICHHGEWFDSDSIKAKAQGWRSPKSQGLFIASVDETLDAPHVAEIVGGLAITARRAPNETSGKILAYLRSPILRGANNELVNQAFALFENAMYDQYGAQPFYRLLEIYFKAQDHPIHILAKHHQI